MNQTKRAATAEQRSLEANGQNKYVHRLDEFPRGGPGLVVIVRASLKVRTDRHSFLIPLDLFRRNGDLQSWNGIMWRLCFP